MPQPEAPQLPELPPAGRDIAQAQILGYCRCANGATCEPLQDGDLVMLLHESEAGLVQLLKAWTTGWSIANLTQPT